MQGLFALTCVVFLCLGSVLNNGFLADDFNWLDACRMARTQGASRRLISD